MSAITKFLISTVAIVFFLAGATSLVALKFLEESAGSPGEAVLFEVRPGDSFKQVASRLEAQGLVKNAKFLSLYARLTAQAQKIRVGEYSIRPDMNPRQVLGVITSGRSIEYSITVSEGLNVYEIAQVVQKQGLINSEEFMTLVRDPKLIRDLLGEERDSLEGYLFPETYHITKFTGARGLIRAMVERFKQNYAQVAERASQIGFSRHQLVTLASIVEKETGAPEERPVISSVFHNRLERRMRLQTDPTVVYGIWDRDRTWNGRISKQDLLTPSRYNTYLISGLPPGPIANPGLEALKAAASPAKTEFLFFVSRNDGTHIFSRDYAGHQRAVVQYQLDRKAREGKSWRDLKNRTETPSTVTDAASQKASPPKKK